MALASNVPSQHGASRATRRAAPGTSPSLPVAGQTGGIRAATTCHSTPFQPNGLLTPQLHASSNCRSAWPRASRMGHRARTARSYVPVLAATSSTSSSDSSRAPSRATATLLRPGSLQPPPSAPPARSPVLAATSSVDYATPASSFSFAGNTGQRLTSSGGSSSSSRPGTQPVTPGADLALRELRPTTRGGSTPAGSSFTYVSSSGSSSARSGSAASTSGRGPAAAWGSSGSSRGGGRGRGSAVQADLVMDGYDSDVEVPEFMQVGEGGASVRQVLRGHPHGLRDRAGRAIRGIGFRGCPSEGGDSLGFVQRGWEGAWCAAGPRVRLWVGRDTVGRTPVWGGWQHGVGGCRGRPLLSNGGEPCSAWGWGSWKRASCGHAAWKACRQWFGERVWPQGQRKGQGACKLLCTPPVPALVRHL